MEDQRHSVVIVGGGVAGLRAALLLSRKSHYDVTLISKKQTFDHNTSLYRNKRGRSLRHLSLELNSVFGRRAKHIDLVRAEITRIDPEQRNIVSSKGIEYSYDSLIVALEGEGRVPHGVDPSFTHNAYSATDMSTLRRLLISEFESSQPEGNYVVIGAGETGVEMAYELKLLMDSLAKLYKRDKDAYTVVLVESANRILPKTDVVASQRVQKRLEKKGIYVYANKEVIRSAKGRLLFRDHKVLQSSLLITAAGRKANPFFSENSEAFLLNQSGFVRVNELQEAEGYNNVYVLGNSKDHEHDLNLQGKLYDAEYVTSLMESKRGGKELDEYDPPSYSAHLQLGRTWGVHETAHRVFSGRLGLVRKRWSDRSHFSTLLPIRLWFVAWLWGTQHDEIY